MNRHIDTAGQGTTARCARLSIRAALLSLGLISLTACSSSDDDDGNGNGNGMPVDATGGDYGYVAVRAADFSSGRIDRLSLSDGITVVGSYPATQSDIAITTDGTDPYQIGRYLIDSITRFDAEDTSVASFQYSVLGDEPVTANPNDIAFNSPSRAYVTRRASDALWIVDPSAETEEDFKLEEIDLGAYDEDAPDMTDAILVDDKLFVLMERLETLPSFSQLPNKNGYVAVINTVTNTEIDTGMGSDGLSGIELSVTNPTALQYNEETGMIYVVGRGNYYENSEISDDYHSGGIEMIDPTSYETTLILDDGTDDDNRGYFVDAEIIDADTGYLLTYTSYGVTTLYDFNPGTGELGEIVDPSLDAVDITTLAVGPDNHLWIGINAATPGFERLNLETGELAAEPVALELVPMDIVFIDVSASED